MKKPTFDVVIRDESFFCALPQLSSKCLLAADCGFATAIFFAPSCNSLTTFCREISSRWANSCWCLCNFATVLQVSNCKSSCKSNEIDTSYLDCIMQKVYMSWRDYPLTSSTNLSTARGSVAGCERRSSSSASHFSIFANPSRIPSLFANLLRHESKLSLIRSCARCCLKSIHDRYEIKANNNPN